MPIQTQGHQVQVMPQYTPMDPSRVTFNPGGLVTGALSGIELIDALTRQKAFAQQQAELAATREGRLGAQNATNLATIQLAPQQNIADIALAQSRAATIPGQTEATLAEQQFQRDIMPFLQGARRQTAETADALAVPRADLEIKQVALDTDKQAREQETAPLQHQVKLLELNQSIESIANDKNLTDQQKIANIRLANANANAAEANADYTERNRPKANVKDEQMKEISQLQLEIQRLQATPVLNPNVNNTGLPVPFLQYQGQTRDASGALLRTDAPGWFTGDQPMAVNPEAERIATQLKILQDRRDALTKALVAPPAAAGGGYPQIVVPGLGGAPTAVPNFSGPPATPTPLPSPSSPAPKATPAKAASGPKTITTAAEFNALKPGDSFIFNGKTGVKTK